MQSSRCRTLTLTLLCVGSLVLQSPILLADCGHVVSPAKLQQAVARTATTRQENVIKVEKFFSSKIAMQAMESAHIDPVQIKNAVPSLSDQELAQLASKADKTQQSFAAGDLTNRQITYIIVAAAIVIIVIAVA